VWVYGAFDRVQFVRYGFSPIAEFYGADGFFARMIALVPYPSGEIASADQVAYEIVHARFPRNSRWI